MKLSPGARYIALRIAFIPLAAYAVMTVSFFLVNLVPSNPAQVVLGALATPGQIRAFNQRLGLDESVFVRYGHYVDGLFHGNLGASYYDQTSVAGAISNRLTSSLELIIAGLAVAWVLGTALGILAACFRGRFIDNVVSAVIAVLQAVPDFVVGLLGALLLFFALRWLPAPVGQLPVGVTPPPTITGAAFVDSVLQGYWGLAGQAAQQMVLPVLALGVFNSVVFARTVRATLSEALDAPYSDFALARGLRRRTVVRLAARASMLPTITYGGIVLAALVGGDAIVETVFSWQGLGQWGVTGVERSDIPVVEGFVMVAGIIAVVAYLLADILTFVLDPRVRRSSASGPGRRRPDTLASATAGVASLSEDAVLGVPSVREEAAAVSSVAGETNR